MPRGLRQQRREAEAELAARTAEAARTHECTACGRRFEGLASYQLHIDFGRCLPDTLLEANHLMQLRDGVWAEAWRHPGTARR